MQAKILLLCATSLFIKHVSAGNSDPSQATAICAAPGSDSILVAHEDCNKFYKCFQGRPVAIDCPPYLLYNPDMEYCDYPENVNNVYCQRDYKEDYNNDDDRARLGNSDPSQAPAICAAPGSDSILVAHEDCRKFYICGAGRPIPMNCPRGLFFNPDRDWCDYTWNVNNLHCTRPITETFAVKIAKANSDPSQATAICAESGSNGVLVAHEECSKFYMCAGGRPVAKDCPIGLLFNPEKDYCDWSTNNVNCQRSLSAAFAVNFDIGKGNSDPSQAPAICAAAGSDSILVAHEDCSKFYKCFQGRPVAIDCPPYLLYNPNMEYCDYPENVNNPNCQRSINEVRISDKQAQLSESSKKDQWE